MHGRIEEVDGDAHLNELELLLDDEDEDGQIELELLGRHLLELELLEEHLLELELDDGQHFRELELELELEGHYFELELDEHLLELDVDENKGQVELELDELEGHLLELELVHFAELEVLDLSNFNIGHTFLS